MCASPRTFAPSLYRASTDALITQVIPGCAFSSQKCRYLGVYFMKMVSSCLKYPQHNNIRRMLNFNTHILMNSYNIIIFTLYKKNIVSLNFSVQSMFNGCSCTGYNLHEIIVKLLFYIGHTVPGVLIVYAASKIVTV